MATPQKGEGFGSDEATDGIQDLCAYCVARDRPQPALHFCFECGPYGRYICGSCAQFHNLFTQGHTFLRISDSKKQQSKIANELETEKKKNAELQSKLDDKDRDLDQMRERINMQTDLLDKTKRAMSVLETTKKENTEMRSTLADKNRELQQLRDRLKDEYMSKHTMSSELELQKELNSKLQSKLADAIFKMNQLTDQFNTEQRMHTELREKETQIKKEKLLKVVLLIQRSWRAKLIVRKLRKEMANKTSQRTEANALFEEIKVDDSMCGICGVFFGDKLERNLELGKSVFVGGRSVLNTSQAESAIWGGQPVQKLVNYEGKRNPWGTTRENTLDKPELRKTTLLNIRSEHIQEPRHIQKTLEFQSFKNKYRQHIAPKLRDINSFLYNPVFNLTDYNNVEKNFGREYMAIDRMFRKGKLVEKEIQLLLKSRMWSVTAGLVEQKVMELEDDFRTVKPYVEVVHLKLTQEEEENAKQVSASANAMSAHAENLDDELEVIEPVVKEPTPRRKRMLRNRRRREREKNYH